jgi:hypothetical protein
MNVDREYCGGIDEHESKYLQRRREAIGSTVINNGNTRSSSQDFSCSIL